MSKPQPPRYRTTNWPTYNRELERRGSMLVLIDPEMQWLAEPAGKMGRPAVFSDAAIQLCLSVKVLFKLPLRQAVGMVRALLKLAGLDWPAPDYTTLCRRQKTLAVQIPYWACLACRASRVFPPAFLPATQWRCAAQCFGFGRARARP